MAAKGTGVVRDGHTRAVGASGRVGQANYPGTPLRSFHGAYTAAEGAAVKHRCQHDTTWLIKYVQGNDPEDPDSAKDKIELSICAACGHIIRAKCEHERRAWNGDETKLSCLFCHADLT